MPPLLRFHLRIVTCLWFPKVLFFPLFHCCSFARKLYSVLSHFYNSILYKTEIKILTISYNSNPNPFHLKGISEFIYSQSRQRKWKARRILPNWEIFVTQLPEISTLTSSQLFSNISSHPVSTIKEFQDTHWTLEIPASCKSQFYPLRD